QSEQPVVCRVVLTGEVGGGLKERFQRRLDRAREMSEKEQKPLIIIVQIGCGDGDVNKAADMARALLKVSDRTAARPVETIAHVHWVESVKGKTDMTFITHADFVADQARDPKERRWNSKQELRTSPGGYLALTADAAAEFGVIDKVADDWDGACELAGVKKED